MIYLFRWESRIDKALRELQYEQQEEYIQSLEKRVEEWKEMYIEASDKYIDLLIKSSK